jgi:hypothetical protein
MLCLHAADDADRGSIASLAAMDAARRQRGARLGHFPQYPSPNSGDLTKASSPEREHPVAFRLAPCRVNLKRASGEAHRRIRDAGVPAVELNMDTAFRCLVRIDRLTWLLTAALAVLGGYLLWDRGDVLVAALPSILLWLVILACPLMHILMHRHGGHGGHRSNAEPENRPDRRHEHNETSVDKGELK